MYSCSNSCPFGSGRPPRPPDAVRFGSASISLSNTTLASAHQWVPQGYTCIYHRTDIHRIYIFLRVAFIYVVLYYQRVRDDDDDDDGFPTVFLSLYAIQSNLLWGYKCRLLFQTGSSQTICQFDSHGLRAKLAIRANFNQIDCLFDLPFYKGGGPCYVY